MTTRFKTNDRVRVTVGPRAGLAGVVRDVFTSTQSPTRYEVMPDGARESVFIAENELAPSSSVADGCVVKACRLRWRDLRDGMPSTGDVVGEVTLADGRTWYVCFVDGVVTDVAPRLLAKGAVRVVEVQG